MVTGIDERLLVQVADEEEGVEIALNPLGEKTKGALRIILDIFILKARQNLNSLIQLFPNKRGNLRLFLRVLRASVCIAFITRATQGSISLNRATDQLPNAPEPPRPHAAHT